MLPILVIVLFAFSLTPSAARDDRAFAEAKLKSVSWGQYMHKACHPLEVPNWKGFDTEKCSYNSPSGFGVVPVVMLNPSAKRLSRWITTACADAKLPDIPRCAERVALQIKCQSNNQFPVAGLVDEGALYIFRDGVTVSVEGIDTGGNIGLNRPPTKNENVLSLSGNVSKVHSYARVVGTSRHEFANFTNQDLSVVDNLRWMTVIREEYQQAWNSKRNRLMSAWAASHSSELSEHLPFDVFLKQKCPKDTRWNRWFP